eukprot:CAMPEP_0119400806 /NCGR_PEP_ID=MMETSP1334-20130426/142052_1 /TAXON_ID=127549 /ORGANISM="Calcidiscus leptoporus, Strain RCC1130" /LENGTH=165 /DNA_ID=CAMNT_0007424715 /DNA_START=281 /DNA_END=775 /DNA_ORIENTATION=-
MMQTQLACKKLMRERNGLHSFAGRSAQMRVLVSERQCGASEASRGRLKGAPQVEAEQVGPRAGHVPVTSCSEELQVGAEQIGPRPGDVPVTSCSEELQVEAEQIGPRPGHVRVTSCSEELQVEAEQIGPRAKEAIGCHVTSSAVGRMGGDELAELEGCASRLRSL